MKIRTRSIDWDITDDNFDDDETPESLGLPQEVVLEVDDEDEVCDALSDQYGFCINSLDYEIINE